MAVGIVKQAAANTSALSFSASGRAALPSGFPANNSLSAAYHWDKGANALADYKSYNGEGRLKLFLQDGTAVNNQKPSAVCETCASRKYQDKSNDPGVSFQMATHVNSAASVSMVASHEQEHVAQETKEAEENGQKAITNVRIHMDQCPECKKWYASGGVTEVTKISTGNPIANLFKAASGKDF